VKFILSQFDDVKFTFWIGIFAVASGNIVGKLLKSLPDEKTYKFHPSLKLWMIVFEVYDEVINRMKATNEEVDFEVEELPVYSKEYNKYNLL
jgi:hypothetical protein